jgi:hypothetical protein
MQELQRNSLLENVNLIFEDCSDDLLAVLITMLPSIASIYSIKILGLALWKSAYSEMGKRVFKSTRILEIW